MRHPEHPEFEAQIDSYLLGRLNAEETERFEKHYFDCPDCFRLTAERAALLDAVKAAGPAPAAAAVKASDRTGFRRFPLGWVSAGVAVALLAAAVFLIVPRPPRPPDFPDSGNRTVRGESMVLIAPVGVLGRSPKEFVWRPVGGAAEYAIILAGIEPAWTAETRKTSIKIPAEIAGRIAPGKTYAWKVKAYAAEGTLLAASSETLFSIAR
ncbi:MAG: zf-HC2 domain-containing protein [Candidatus Aminicenantes bacterium]|nr:zf-HC2 domain-containing protein [Candidatus Aminicenantes bacterium]